MYIYVTVIHLVVDAVVLVSPLYMLHVVFWNVVCSTSYYVNCSLYVVIAMENVLRKFVLIEEWTDLAGTQIHTIFL